MTDTEITTKIEAIRKELRDGRNSRNESASGTSQNSDGHSGVSDTKKQRTRGNVRSNDVSDGGNVRPLDNFESSIDQEPFRRGRRSGRSSQGSSGVDAVADDVGRSNVTSGT